MQQKVAAEQLKPYVKQRPIDLPPIEEFIITCIDPGITTGIVWWHPNSDIFLGGEITKKDPAAWLQEFIDHMPAVSAVWQIIAIEGWEHQPYKMGNGEAKAPKGYKQRGQKIAEMVRVAQTRYNLRTLLFLPSEMSGIRANDIELMFDSSAQAREKLIIAAGKNKKDQQHIKDACRLALYASSWVRTNRQLMRDTNIKR